MCMFHIVALHLNNTTTVTASSFLSHLQPSVQTTRPSVQIARKISFNSAALQLKRWNQIVLGVRTKLMFGNQDRNQIMDSDLHLNIKTTTKSASYHLNLLVLGLHSFHYTSNGVFTVLCASQSEDCSLSPQEDQKEDHIPPVLRSLHWLPVNKDCWRFKKSQNTRLTCCHLTNHPDPSGRLRGRTKPKKQRSLLLLHIKSCRLCCWLQTLIKRQRQRRMLTNFLCFCILLYYYYYYYIYSISSLYVLYCFWIVSFGLMS